MTDRPAWTRESVNALGLTTDVPTGGSIFGLSDYHSYHLARTGQFPVPVLRLGRCLRVSVPAILRLLDADDFDAIYPAPRPSRD